MGKGENGPDLSILLGEQAAIARHRNLGVGVMSNLSPGNYFRKVAGGKANLVKFQNYHVQIKVIIILLN